VHGSASGVRRTQAIARIRQIALLSPIYPQCGGNSNGVLAQLDADLQPAVTHTLGLTA